jgi:glucose-6-phosphate isomerase
MTITVKRVDAATIGALIALFERSVGLYASLVNINAYHQPGVEAGKKAAGIVIELQKKVRVYLADHPQADDPAAVAAALGMPDAAEMVYAVMRRIGAH